MIIWKFNILNYFISFNIMTLNYFKTVGVGILLVEKNNDDYEFILVHNKYLNTYDIPGGRIDNNISEMETGQKELYEETLGLFKIKKSVLFKCKHAFFTQWKETYKLYKILTRSKFSTGLLPDLIHPFFFQFFIHSVIVFTNNNESE